MGILRTSEMASNSASELQQAEAEGVDMVPVAHEKVTPLPPTPQIVRMNPSVQAVMSKVETGL